MTLRLLGSLSSLDGLVSLVLTRLLVAEYAYV